MRRRLAHGRGVPAEEYGWKPFGITDYGYDEQYKTVSSWIIWALVTWGSFTINPIEAGLLLAGSVAAQEYRAQDHETLGWRSGASWVHNIQAGYCWYHHFIKGRQEWGTVLGSYAELTGDLGAILEEYASGKNKYNHHAHYQAASIGIAVAFLMDMISKNKKGTKFSWWYKAVPFAVIAIMVFADRNKKM